MNTFGDYVTSTAFSLSLSKRMVEALASYRYPKYRDMLYESGHGLMSINALERRGLVERVDNRNGGPRRAHRITKEGYLVLELCKCAGLLDESLLDQVNQDGFEFGTLQRTPV